MTLPTSSSSSKMSRRVSSVETSSDPGQEGAVMIGADAAETVQKSNLRRQVSNEGFLLGGYDLDDSKAARTVTTEGRGSPVRCVSEFDKASSSSGLLGVCDEESVHDVEIKTVPTPIPPFPNPLHNPMLLAQHVRALRLEADLHPMRLIVSRLMSHPTHNRKGIFNAPVDPVALGLPDYFMVISKPMDLGTIKARLHAIAYQSRKDVADDIRLVFDNAMKYNPPHNAVHIAASNLMAFFEEQVEAFVPDVLKEPKPLQSELIASVIGGGKRKFALKESHDDMASEHASLLGTVLPGDMSERGVQGKGEEALDQEFCGLVSSPEKKRCKRGSKKNLAHSCQWCQGRKCSVCLQGCMYLEPPLLICSGGACAGARIRKAAIFYICRDGSRQYCQRCYTGLPAVLPRTGQDETIRFKRDLLKRKNDEEVVESWLTCVRCEKAAHRFCVMQNEFASNGDDYHCPECVIQNQEPEPCVGTSEDHFTFLSGSDVPVRMSDITGISEGYERNFLTSATLPSSDVSSFIELKVKEVMRSAGVPNAERTISVRMISHCDKNFKVPEIVRKHFQMTTNVGDRVSPPVMVGYRSKAIALFQKIDGLDVCIFCMYVHEYDGQDEFDVGIEDDTVVQKKRVYIAYLDSVEHFRPRACRTKVFQEVLVAYLATARQRGYESAHIWACPPSRGNSFVFWNHPASQRTPTQERLDAWYHSALSRAIGCGVVTDVKSLFETDFEEQVDQLEKTPPHEESSPSSLLCPPLLEGDYWIEEAVRIHAMNVARCLRTKPNESMEALRSERCVSRQFAGLLERIIAHPSSIAFRRPVNVSALKLKDYHKIVTKPMDLGTIHWRCCLGEYETLKEAVEDVELVFSNARRYNPVGHILHSQAIEVEDVFFAELNELTKTWTVATVSGRSLEQEWRYFEDISMSLDAEIDLNKSSRQANVEKGQVEEDVEKSRKESGGKDIKPLGANPEAVLNRMVGSDKWILEKKAQPAKVSPAAKKSSRKRKCTNENEEPLNKRRRQAWLGEEVGASVRRNRTSFFNCSLVPDCVEHGDRVTAFHTYIADFRMDETAKNISSLIADARHSLLEFSQFRRLEFDTLRHAKYSTAILLYHWHHDEAPGVFPICSMCNRDIKEVRWHRVCKVIENNRTAGKKRPGQTAGVNKTTHQFPQDLCTSCFSAQDEGDSYIPLQVSLRKRSM